jgi:hypothetical protein
VVLHVLALEQVPGGDHEVVVELGQPLQEAHPVLLARDEVDIADVEDPQRPRGRLGAARRDGDPPQRVPARSISVA